MSSTDTLNSPTPSAAFRHDDPSAAEPARQRLARKKSLFQVLHLSPKKAKNHISRKKFLNSSSGTSTASVANHLYAADLNADTDDPSSQLVDIHDGEVYLNDLDENYDKDVYRWAVLYENQRGATVFSTPYYSPMSLLPMDPPSFTIPISDPSLPQPTVSLTEYPLPDGTWRWVSREWMIDMRGDAQVQYDGFEYSWSFHSKKWRSNIGFLSAGGLVRRRRWIRLMMRPRRPLEQEITSAPSSSNRITEMLDVGYTQTVTGPPPVISEQTSEDEVNEVWKGDEDDWARCHAALKRLGCDGMKLELWKAWLGDDRDRERNGRKRHKLQWSDDPGLVSPEEDPSNDADDAPYIRGAPRQPARAVIRTHGSDIINLLIYPESRVQLMESLRHTGFLSDFKASLPSGDSQLLDFWSDIERMQGGCHK